jgi:hypothetical protein
MCCSRCELLRFEILWGALYVGSEVLVTSMCFQGNAVCIIRETYYFYGLVDDVLWTLGWGAACWAGGGRRWKMGLGGPAVGLGRLAAALGGWVGCLWLKRPPAAEGLPGGPLR